MADYSVQTRWSDAAENPAQPSGLTQASQQWMTGAWTPPETPMGDAKAWAGGRNLEGETNGWSNDFYTRAMGQYNRFSDTAIKSGKQSSFYNWLDSDKNPEATGVATWSDAKRGIRAGDVFDNGVKKENLYDLYDEHTANVMLGAFMFDGSRQQRMNRTPHPDRAWSEAVGAEVAQNTRAAENVESAEDFQADTDQYQEDWKEWTGAGAAATGFAGGAGIGAGIGSIIPGVGTLVGAVAGGIIGGISGWLNQDQFSEVAARARATADRARGLGTSEMAFSYLEGAGRVAMFGLQPFQNTVQGVYDGKTGDARSDWYEPVDPAKPRSGVWEAFNLGGAVLDAVGTFGNAAAVTAYMGAMGATTVGKSGVMALDDSVFNERTGRFDNIEGWAERSGAYGSVAIDLVQMTQAGAITRAGGRARAAFGTSEQKAKEAAARTGLGRLDATQGVGAIDRLADKMWAGVRGKRGLFDENAAGPTASAAMTQTVNGIKFFRTAEGEVVGSRLTMQMVAPSEFVKWVPTGFRARQMKALDDGAVGPDDLYRAALYMTDSGSVVGRALLNAYAESTEEMAQAYLEPRATGDSATWKDLQQAALYGAAGGFGMGFGGLGRGPTQEQRKMAVAQLHHMQRTGEVVEEKEWKARWDKMSSPERQRLYIAQPEETEELRKMLDTLQERQTMEDASWSPLGVMAESDKRLNNHMKDTKNPRNDNTLRLGGFSGDRLVLPDSTFDTVNFETTKYSANEAVLSAWDLVDTLRRNAAGVRTQDAELKKLQAKAADDLKAATKASDQDAIDVANEEIARLKARQDDTDQSIEMAELMLDTIEEMYVRYRDERDPGKQAKWIEQMNTILERSWEGVAQFKDGQTPQQLEMLRRTVEFQTTRHPVIDKGSLSILKLRVSLGLSRQGVRGSVYTHQSLLKTIGGDHDGDTRVTLNFMYLPPAERADLLRGAYAHETELRPTDEQIEAGFGLRTRREWKLLLDRPDGEAKFLENFARWSSDPSNDQYDIVGDGIGTLKKVFHEAYSKAANPANPLDADIVEGLLNDLEADIRAGVADAAVKFTEGLINSRPGAYQDIQLNGERNRRMEIPWIMERFNVVWDEITVKVSDYNYLHRAPEAPRDEARKIADQNYLRGKAILRSVGRSYDQAALLGPEPVRSGQKIHYSSFLHAAIDLLDMKKTKFVPDAVRELGELYMQLGSGQVASDLDLVRGKDRIEKRVLDWLAKMVEQVPEVDGKPHMMMVLASTAVRDVEIIDEDQVSIRDGEISLLQLLLRRSLQIERGLADKAPPDDPIHAKIRRLEGLTRAQGPNSYSASSVLFEVFGGFKAQELLGEDTAGVGPNVTLAQLFKMFIGMTPAERNKRFSTMRSPLSGYMRLPDDDSQRKDPPYSAEVYQKGLMNGYSVFVDAFRAVVNNEFKNMERKDKASIKQLENGFQEWQNVKAKWRAEFGKKTKKGQNVSDEELLTDLLNNAEPRLLQLILDLIPDASRQGAFQINPQDGKVYSSKWVKEMLLETNAKQAAKIYWLNTKLEDWRVMGGMARDEDDIPEDGQSAAIDGVRFGRIRSRFLQSLYHVAADPDGLGLQAFLMNAHNAPDIQSIIDGINNNPSWLGGREKLLAMHDDVALFEADPKDLWAADLPGSIQREAIKGWGEKVGSYGKRSVRSRVNKDVETTSLKAMDQVLRTLPGQKLPDDKSSPLIPSAMMQDLGLANLFLLRKTIQNRQKFMDGLGQNARSQYHSAVIEGLVQMHNKGAADRRVAPVGAVPVLADASGVKQGIAREVDGVTERSFQDVLSNPTELVRGPVRIMMPNGETEDIDFSTVRGALDMLLNPRTNALAKAVLFPTVRDVNIVNATETYLDVKDPTDFTKMLQDETFVDLMRWGGGRPSAQQAKRFIDLIESNAREEAIGKTPEERKAAMYPIMGMVDDFLVAYDQNPFRTPADRQGMVDGLYIDIAMAIRQVSMVEKGKRPRMLQAIQAAMQDRYFDSGAIDDLAKTDVEKIFEDMGAREAIMQTYKARVAAIDELLDSGVSLATEDQLKAERTQLRDDVTQMNNIEGQIRIPRAKYREYAALVNMYRVDENSPSAEMQKDKVIELLGKNSNLNKFETNAKVMPVIQKLRNMAYHTPQALYDRERMTQEEWDIASGWCAQLLGAEEMLRPGSTMRLLSDGGKYFDQTFAYLVEPLFTQQILDAASYIRESAKDRETTTDDRAVKEILNTLMNERRMGRWNQFVPIESQKRRKILETSPVGLAIPTAGIDPVAYADIVGATMLTEKLPDETKHLSMVTLVSDDPLNFTVWDELNGQPELFIKLQNHFVKSIKIKSRSAEFRAKHPDPDVTGLVTSNNYQSDAVSKSPYKVLHIDELQRMIDVWRENDGLTDYEIEIEYVDVDKKPFTREYANNIFFDGVGRNSAASTSRGPIAAMIFSLMGISKLGQQQPLDAATKGGSAYKPYVPTKLVTIEEIEKTASSVTEYMSKKALHLWGIEYDTGHLLSSDLPALYKSMKMRHVIRVKDTVNGGTKLVWPEELIVQEATTGQPTDMKSIKIIPLSEDVSRALYGASGFEAVNTALNEPILNLEDMDKFPSLDKQRLERLGLSRLGQKADPGNTLLAQIVLPQRARKSDLAGAKPRNLFEARVKRWRKLAVDVLEARVTTSRKGVTNFDPERISSGGALMFADMMKAEKAGSLMTAMGIPMGGLQDLQRTTIADVLLRNIAKLKTSPEQVIWQHVQEGKYSLADGVLTQESVANNFSGMKGMGPTYGDTVVIDIGSILLSTGENQEEAFRVARRVISSYADRGVNIVLGSAKGDQHFRSSVSLWLQEGSLGYESFANSQHVFVPMQKEGYMSMNQRTLSSMNTAVEVLDTRYMALALLSDDFSAGASENNVYTDTERDPLWKRTSAVILASSLTITDYDKQKEHLFNIPASGRQRDAAAQKVRDAIKDHRKYLIEMAKGGTDSSEPPGTRPYRENKAKIPGTNRRTFDPGIRSIEDALKRLDKMLQAGKLPTDPGSVLMVGDLIPFVDQQGNVFLQRHGFSLTHKGDLETQLNTAPDKTSPPLGIAMSLPRLEDAQTVTPPMTIQRVYQDPRRGLVLEGEWELDKMSKTIWEGAGFKAGAAELPGHWKPLQALSRNGSAITRFTSVKAPFGKGSVEGVVDNFRDAFVVFGMDFRPFLVDFFFGKDPSRDQSTYDGMVHDVEMLLREWSEINHGLTSDEAAKLLDANTIVRYAQERISNLLAPLNLSFPNIDLDSYTNGTAEAQLVRIMLSALAAPGVRLEHVLQTSGLLTVEDTMSDAQLLRMPTLFTDALDNAVANSELRKVLFTEMNKRVPTGYTLAENWTFNVDIGITGLRGKGGDGVFTPTDAYLQYILPAPTDESPSGYVQSGMGRRQQQTQHVTNVLNITGGGRIAIDPGMKIDPKTGEVTFRTTAIEQQYKNKIIRFEDGSGQKFYDMITSIDPNDDTYSQWVSDLPLQALYKTEGAAKRRIYRQVVDKTDDGWEREQRIRVEGKQDQLIKILGLTKYALEARLEVDYLVRQFLGAPGPTTEQPDYAGKITGDLYLQAIELIITNAQSPNYRNPLHGGVVFVMDRHLVQTIYEAQQDRPINERWSPMIQDGKRKVRASGWDEWIDGFLGQFQNSNQQFLSMFLTDVDGFLHTWHEARPGLGDLPVSMSKMRDLQLMNAKVNDAVLSLDPGLEAVLHDPIILDSMKQTLDMLIGHKPVFNQLHAGEAYESDLAKQFDKQKKWLASKKLPKQEKIRMKDYMKEGTFYRTSKAYDSQLMKNLVNLSLTMRLANPALWFSALMEVPARNMLEHITNEITGSSIGKLSMTSRYTPEQQRKLKELAKQMGQREDFMRVLYDEMAYNNLLEAAGDDANGFSRWLESLAGKTARATSDPRYGLGGTAVASRYIEAAMEYFHLTNTSITPEQFVYEMSKDPLWLRKQYSETEEKGLFSPHRAGMNRVAQVRGQKQTLMAKFLMTTPDWMCASNSGMLNFSGHLLRIPFMFTRFNINALMTISGLTAWDQAAAMFFDSRKKPAFLRRAGKPDTWDNNEIIETLDLQRTFLRSGVTYSMVMTLGLMAGGLGGDDEEERRRRRLMENLNLPHYLDPGDSQNAFTNADAMYLDSVPFLGRFFKGAQYDDPETAEDERQAIAVPHWIMKQFTSPIIGISRFFENGDVREIGWGFFDAFSAIPNSVMRIWDEADVTANLLAQQASVEANKGTAQGQANASSLLIQIVGMYERALFENSFANTLRSAGDKYDRNPYLIPGVDPETGEMLRQPGTGLPLPQKDALVSYINEDGDVQQAYMTRQGKDGELHQYAENNLTFALVASLFTGLGESSFLRKNMAPRQQEIQRPDITLEEFEAFVMSTYQGSGGQENLTQEEIIQQLKQRDQDNDVWWDQEDIEAEAEAIYNSQPGGAGALSIISPEAKEVITLAGADSVFTSLANGGLQLGDPALDGFAADQEMRDALAEVWGERLVQEGIDLGLSFESANYRARRLWYGDNTNKDVPGLREIIYSREIPKENDLVYNQLNMTYAIGPDGKPWATPFPKMGLLQALGVPIPTEMLTPGPGLRLDQQGRIVDMTTGEHSINTGLSGLEKVVELNDIEMKDDAFEKGSDKNSGGSGGGKKFGRTPWRRYSGGGGGGGGYTPQMRALPGGVATRFEGIQMINTSNPFIRRADVYKQRIWSERGRLKQWQ